jgi:hypothetical protein
MDEVIAPSEDEAAVLEFIKDCIHILYSEHIPEPILRSIEDLISRYNQKIEKDYVFLSDLIYDISCIYPDLVIHIVDFACKSESHHLPQKPARFHNREEEQEFDEMMYKIDNDKKEWIRLRTSGVDSAFDVLFREKIPMVADCGTNIAIKEHKETVERLATLSEAELRGKEYDKKQLFSMTGKRKPPSMEIPKVTEPESEPEPEPVLKLEPEPESEEESKTQKSRKKKPSKKTNSRKGKPSKPESESEKEEEIPDAKLKSRNQESMEIYVPYKNTRSRKGKPEPESESEKEEEIPDAKLKSRNPESGPSKNKKSRKNKK